MNYLGNALSLGMIDMPQATIRLVHLSLDSARSWVRERSWASCVGHADTALLLTEMLSVSVELRRVTTSLVAGDEMLVAQYNGPRLPEGAISLPEGAKIRWILAAIG